MKLKLLSLLLLAAFGSIGQSLTYLEYSVNTTVLDEILSLCKTTEDSVRSIQRYSLENPEKIIYFLNDSSVIEIQKNYFDSIIKVTVFQNENIYVLTEDYSLSYDNVNDIGTSFNDTTVQVTLVNQDSSQFTYKLIQPDNNGYVELTTLDRLNLREFYNSNFSKMAPLTTVITSLKCIPTILSVNMMFGLNTYRLSEHKNDSTFLGLVVLENINDKSNWQRFLKTLK